jgi:hypothetical protein
MELSEDVVYLGAVACFVLALTEETNKTEEVSAIRKKCTQYVASIRRFSKELEVVANEAWEIVCGHPEANGINPEVTASLILDNHEGLLSKHLKISHRHVKKLFNKHREHCSYKERIGSSNVASACSSTIRETVVAHGSLFA